MVTRLEEGIQKRFVTIGSQLEFAVRERLQGNLPGMAAIAGLRQQLNAAMGVIDDFNRDMLRLVEDVKKETYFGIEFDLSPRTLERFSTLELIQALFKKRMQTYSVIRTTADLGEPKRGRY